MIAPSRGIWGTGLANCPRDSASSTLLKIPQGSLTEAILWLLAVFLPSANFCSNRRFYHLTG
jgi:hypothetical protein